jgi:polysaccharide export outer membrane protein
MQELLRKFAFLFFPALVGATAAAQLISPAPTVPGIGPSPSSQTPLQRLKIAQHPELRFAPDDNLAISLYQVKDFALRVRVDQAGNIQLPLIGNVAVQGLTAQETKTKIETLLKTGGMVEDPQISLFLDESPSRFINISGSVAKPVRVPAFGDQTLYSVLTAAGGLTNDAGHVVTVLRPGFDGPIAIEMNPGPLAASDLNIPLFAGDTVLVPRSGVVYVVGALRNQGAFPLKGSTPLTATQAIALAGGAGFEALLNEVHLVRTVSGTRTDILLDVNRIRAGRAQDPALQPDDILFLPTSATRAAIKGGAVSIAANLATGIGYVIAH